MIWCYKNDVSYIVYLDLYLRCMEKVNKKFMEDNDRSKSGQKLEK